VCAPLSDPLSSRVFMAPFAQVRMSWRAAILRSILRFEKRLLSRRQKPIPTVRDRLKLIEPFVPGPPKGTQTIPVDAGGVSAVQVGVRQARSDRCVLFFHGGGYAVGTARLYRDFLWRLGVAVRAQVLYFDYRLAPEHPFPAALDDLITVYRWLANPL
jgi:epsilon-lactone hydrolase